MMVIIYDYLRKIEFDSLLINSFHNVVWEICHPSTEVAINVQYKNGVIHKTRLAFGFQIVNTNKVQFRQI